LIKEKTDPALAALVRGLFQALVDGEVKAPCKLYLKLKGKQINNALENSVLQTFMGGAATSPVEVFSSFIKRIKILLPVNL
jgi:hypothetical protein